MESLCENSVTGDYSVEGLIPKKVQFRDNDECVNIDWLVDQDVQPTISWKDKLVGLPSNTAGKDLDTKEDFDVLEGDIQKSIINGIPSIHFSNSIQQILIRDLDNNMILKLLGRNIGYSILQNKIYNLWKPSSSFCLMDIEHGYFLAKFKSVGPWIIFGQYLIVQQWSVSFNPAQTFPSMVMSWIRFPSLPSYMYKRKILVEMGGVVSKIVKLDMNTYNIAKGRFARMVVYVNLDRYGHMKDVGPFRLFAPCSRKNLTSSELLLEGGNMTGDGTGENSETYGPWMLVEKKSRRKSRNPSQIDTKIKTKKIRGLDLRLLQKWKISLELKLVIEMRIWFWRNLENFDFLRSLEMIITFRMMMVTSEGVVDVTEAEMNNYLDPCKHTMINFKEFKDLSSGISMEGAPLRFLGEGGGMFVRLDRDLANGTQASYFLLPKGKPFRFLAGWTNHAKFPTSVKDKWNYLGNMVDSLTAFTSHVKEWNMSVYGFIGPCKRHIMKSLSSIQKALDHLTSNRLYGKLLDPMKGLPSNIFLWIKFLEIAFLEKLISNEEIKRALFDMDPLKPPSSDGFHAHFFQSQWDIVSNAICEWVQEIFASNNICNSLIF
ncbi:hypothetical protein Goshw_022641 [Gossypium schwendimanii]|uniref:DUF4283 domain-containing protein n=1 Tax=Gossypium schwendimanii TaxID=34291 RepID=A0A7J9L565_GOSSC|nr:hypothetical protein [Gossypium schwendimanii]